MNKKELLELINNYQEKYNQEDLRELVEFINENEDPYTRKNQKGHITCSTWILDEKVENALLIHHKKYDKWLQPGGHMEEGETVFEAARREGMEETGVESLNFVKEGIFDIDIHKIPENKKKGEPEHYHFDLRFVTKVVGNKIKIQEEEVNGYKWASLKKLKKIENDESIVRLVEKSYEIKPTQKLKRKIR